MSGPFSIDSDCRLLEYRCIILQMAALFDEIGEWSEIKLDICRPSAIFCEMRVMGQNG